MSRKTEHRTEYRDVAQQLDAIALPLVESVGLAEAYRVAAVQVLEQVPIARLEYCANCGTTKIITK